MKRLTSSNDYRGLLKELVDGRGDLTVGKPCVEVLKQMKKPKRKAGSGLVRKRRAMGKRNLHGNRSDETPRRIGRRMVTVDNFILFNFNRRDGSMEVGGVLSVTAEPEFLTDKDKFMRSVAEGILCMYHLNSGWDEVPLF